MTKRTLSPSDDGKSGKVTLPKGDLELDGVVDVDGRVVRHQVDVRRVGPGRYEVIVLNDSLQPISRSLESGATEPETAD